MDIDVQELIHGCELNADCMNGWEQDFVESIQEQVDDGHELTDRQMNKLIDIHSRVTRL